MKRLVFVFVLMVFPATIESQTITVGYRQTIQIPARDIVAAFSLDDYYAKAKVADEILVILGRNPGRVRIVEVGPSRSTSLEVIILPGPLSYPPGFVPPLSAAAASESSSYESRYTSYPAQSQNTVDLMRREGDRAVLYQPDRRPIDPSRQGKRSALMVGAGAGQHAVGVLHLELAPRFPGDGDGSGADDQRDHQQGLNDAEIQGVTRNKQRGDCRGNDREETKEPGHFQVFPCGNGLSLQPSCPQAIPYKSRTSCRQSTGGRAPP